MNCRPRIFINKGFYNRYAADIWMWMIFFEWVQKCTIYFSLFKVE